MRGAYEWSDFLYDDHGAVGATVGLPVAGLAPSRGTYVYSSATAHRNGADIFRLGLAPTGTGSLWRVDWTTLDDPNLPLIAFAIDSDGNTATGGSSWGSGTGLTSPGIDHVLVVSSRGAWVTDVATQHSVALGTAAVTVGHDASRAMGSFVARVPTSALPALSGRWTIRAAAGLATADGRNVAPVPSTNGALPGEPAVYDLGFDPIANEPPSNNLWMEATQAQSLVTGDARAFARRYGMTYPTVVDKGDKLYTKYGLTGVPETFCANARGQVVAHVPGAVKRDTLDQCIQDALSS